MVLSSALLISLTSRYTTAHKFRFGELMFHHKLGWQTSDQQDKAVSCEAGVLSASASGLQAAGAGAQASAPGLPGGARGAGLATPLLS